VLTPCSPYIQREHLSRQLFYFKLNSNTGVYSLLSVLCRLFCIGAAAKLLSIISAAERRNKIPWCSIPFQRERKAAVTSRSIRKIFNSVLLPLLFISCNFRRLHVSCAPLLKFPVAMHGVARGPNNFLTPQRHKDFSLGAAAEAKVLRVYY
jgi:hypothetical protein